MNKKILITGATGFIGANLVRYLIADKNNEVHSLIRKTSDLWRLKGLEDKLQNHVSDLSDVNSLKHLLKSIKPNFIIHAAVYGGFPNQQDFNKIIQTNLQGTVNLLEASKDIDCYFINTGSSSEYGKKDSPMKESDVLNPNTPYGVLKAAATNYCNYFAEKNQKPVVTLRLFSPYGPFEDFKRLIPYVVNCFLKKESLKIGNPRSARDFNFIEDVLEAYKTVIQSEKRFFGEVFNVACGEQHTVQEVVDNISSITNQTLKVDYGKVNERIYDSTKWVGNISKIKEKLGWVPKHSFIEGLRKNVEWFDKNRKIYYGN
jgi:nucleoside-diphosphate-sugar epimerase